MRQGDIRAPGVATRTPPSVVQRRIASPRSRRSGRLPIACRVRGSSARRKRGLSGKNALRSRANSDAWRTSGKMAAMRPPGHIQARAAPPARSCTLPPLSQSSFNSSKPPATGRCRPCTIEPPHKQRKKQKNKKPTEGIRRNHRQWTKNSSRTQPRRTSRALFHISRALVATERFAS